MNVRLDVAVGPGAGTGAGRATDISEGGMRLRAASAVAVGTRLALHLELDGIGVEAVGQVVWRRPDPDGHGVFLGVELVETTPRTKRILREYIRRQAPYLHPIGSPVLTPPRPRPGAQRKGQ
jgi:hypothetical protein